VSPARGADGAPPEHRPSGDRPVLETERLLLRHFRESDFDAYAALLGDRKLMRYLGDGRPMARDEAWRNLALVVGHWELRGFGLWAAEEKETGRLAGRIGFIQPEGWPGFEIGWLLGHAHQGRGLATEGARAALDYAFRELGRGMVISVIDPANAASIRVAERLGERFRRPAELGGRGVLIYGIERAEWLLRSGTDAASR
jgi:RimJ/RimL family protein N-acetyltransferase